MFVRISVLLSLLSVATHAIAAGSLTDGPDANLLYDSDTGRLWIDSSDTGKGTLSYLLSTDADSQDRFTNLDSLRVPFFCFPAESCVGTETNIGGTAPVLSYSAGPLWYFGQLAPTGLSLEELQSFLVLAEYSVDLGLGGTLDLVEWDQIQYNGNTDDGPGADLVYESTTGRVILSTVDVGLPLATFTLATIDEQILRYENSNFGDSRPDGITRNDLFADETVMDLGRILPAGLDSPTTLREILREATYGVRLGSDPTVSPEVIGGPLDLVVVSEFTCGDFDFDGDVDSADLTTMTIGWTGAQMEGQSTFVNGDCDGDGDVDSLDQLRTVLNWTGALNGGGDVANASGELSSLEFGSTELGIVPEPSSRLLLVIAALFAIRKCRHSIRTNRG